MCIGVSLFDSLVIGWNCVVFSCKLDVALEICRCGVLVRVSAATCWCDCLLRGRIVQTHLHYESLFIGKFLLFDVILEVNVKFLNHLHFSPQFFF